MADPERTLTERVASIAPVQVRDVYFRHAAPNRDAFAGGGGGRWARHFPVIYLGQPTDSVVIEAYRHLVDDQGVPAENIRPRVLYTVPVEVERILDLTVFANRDAVGLTSADLTSDVDDYDACQLVAAAAHQLRWHGVLAPAAEGTGTTLALFRDRLSVVELPKPTSQRIWQRLPKDPRRLHLVQDPEEQSRGA
ncbi:RES family NAD+ phosphorylase [uncultured Amnibacterium sp.]|uniref:RES family NAD+ phosphorylase n=1 Tax=uncultured Amnibacterium sp. TaxID=1631851 RepID=UPI0035C95A45